jgi:hypothetical protein
LKALFLVCLLEVNQMRNRFTTGGAPGGPEIEQNDLPFEFGERHLLPLQGLECKIGRRSGGGALPFFRTAGKKEDPSDTKAKGQETIQM